MEVKDVNYCVILAGGIGSRLWPVSRKELPKQFLDWFGTGRTLLQQTYDRFRKIIDAKHIFIVTNEHYADLVREQLPEVAQDRILKEPIRRNTLPSVAWATTCISHLCPHGNVIVSPADQLILEENNFDNDVLKGLDFVGHSDCLLTMGVKPTRPDTGYGYIQAHENMEEGAFARVKSFTEKPALDFARVFMESGEFYWNTGLYLYNVRTMMKAIHDLVPDYRDSLTEAIDAIDEMTSAGCRLISIPCRTCRWIIVSWKRARMSMCRCATSDGRIWVHGALSTTIRSTTGRIMYCSIPKPCCITVRGMSFVCLREG